MSSAKNKKDNLLSVDLNLMSLSDIAKGEVGTTTEVPVADDNGREEKGDKVHAQKKKEMPVTPKARKSDAPVSDKTGWDRFIELAEHYKNEKQKGEPIWVDTGIKNELEHIKRASNLKIGVKSLMNGMLRAFMEQHGDELKKLYASEKSLF